MHVENWRLVLRPLCTALGVLTLAAALVRADDPANDSVEALRKSLRGAGTAGRRAELEKRTAAVKGLGEMSRALLLGEWAPGDLDPERAEIDRAVWASLADRFEQ